MKKALAFIITLAMLAACFIISPVAYADNEVSVYLDGAAIEFDAKPCIINDRTLVPIRGVLEAAGASVSWDEVQRMTIAQKGDVMIKVGVDNPAMTVQKNGITYLIGFEVAPCIINNRTFVAIKPVAEAFDISVSWDGEARRVNLMSAKDVIDTSPYPNTISLSGFIPPKTISVGSSYSIMGTATTNGIFDRVNIKITDVASGKVQINETQFDIDSSDYSLSDIDAKVRFGTLSTGDKLLEITAVTKNESRQSFSYNFNVIKPAGVEIEGEISMLWPVPSSGLITTIFWCDNPFCHSNAGRVNGHAAIDIAAGENEDVIAVSDGEVIKAGFGDYENGFSGYGNFILIDHGEGITTQYSHLYSIYVSEGDIVSAGQVIGGVGNTGNSTGNHLDFNIELNDERCDPLYYLTMHPDARCYEECDKPYFDEAMKKREIVNKELPDLK